MINCGKCNFIVNDLLYAIEQNFCPSCGSSLLENSELKNVNLISSNLLSNNIAKKLGNDERFLLSLFIFKNYVYKDKLDQANEVSKRILVIRLKIALILLDRKFMRRLLRLLWTEKRILMKRLID